MKEFVVEQYKVPITHRPDVCIIGGGAAGVATAIGAARTGLQVLLVEKYGFCGGATVAGLSGTICGLYSSGDHPEQIVFGFADEFYRLLKTQNGITTPVPFGRTVLLPHDSLVWKETADKLLEANNCQVLYHTQFLKAYTNETGKIETLLLKGIEKQFAVQPKYVVDASGDANVVHSINGQTYFGKDGLVQTPTMIFRMGNVDMAAFLQLHPKEIEEKVAEADKSGKYRLPRHHVYIFPMPNGNEVLCNMTRITYPDGSIPLGTSSKDLTFAEIAGRKQAREYARFLMNTFPAFKNAYLVETGAQVGIRQSRSIVGKQQLKNEAVIQAVKSEDAVTHSAWPIEAHGAGDLKIIYLEDDHYDIPFQTLIPEKTTNLLVAGRCMSAEHEALASARVTAQCFGMGYAVGASLGLVDKENISIPALTGKVVRAWMQQNKLKTSHEQNI